MVPMEKSNSHNDAVLCFRVSNITLGISAFLVERILPAVEISPLPGAPPVVSGAFLLEKRIVPVADLRKHLHLRTRELSLSDRIILVNTGELSIGLLADEVIGITMIENEGFYDPSNALSSTEELPKGIEIIDNEMILIQDLKTFLSSSEVEKLKAAIIKKLDKRNTTAAVKT